MRLPFRLRTFPKPSGSSLLAWLPGRKRNQLLRICDYFRNRDLFLLFITCAVFEGARLPFCVRTSPKLSRSRNPPGRVVYFDVVPRQTELTFGALRSVPKTGSVPAVHSLCGFRGGVPPVLRPYVPETLPFPKISRPGTSLLAWFQAREPPY